MQTLILETATEKSCLILAKGEKIIGMRLLSGGPELSKRLALEVSSLLKEWGFLPELVAVGQGPGSFTGIRVGAALAQSLAFGWKIPLIGFCSLQAFEPAEAVVLDARMGGAYIMTQGGKAHLVPPDQVEKSLKNLDFTSPHPQLIQTRFGLSGREAFLAPAHLSQLVQRKYLDEENIPLKLEYLDLKPSSPLS